MRTGQLYINYKSCILVKSQWKSWSCRLKDSFKAPFYFLSDLGFLSDLVSGLWPLHGSSLAKPVRKRHGHCRTACTMLSRAMAQCVQCVPPWQYTT